MSELPDHDRVRDLLDRLDEIQRESRLIRQRIESIRHQSPEWPDRRRMSRLFEGIPPSSTRLADSDSGGSAESCRAAAEGASGAGD
jgi:hypothetical protein